MNKDEILAKSRAENRNKDVYEQEVLKQANQSAVVGQMAWRQSFSSPRYLPEEAQTGVYGRLFSAQI